MIVFDEDVPVHYGFVHLDSGVGGWDEDTDQRAGQRNGLLGAAQPGFLMVTTGMHTGLVPVRVEVHPSAPPVDDTYDEIVEASSDLRGPELSLSTFDWATSFVLPAGGPHRVRLSARDFEAGQDHERDEPTDPIRDSYLLQLWPAPMAPDEIIVATSESAQYWHDLAREGSSTARSAEEQALDEQQKHAQALEEETSFERELQLRRWGGREPSPRLLQVADHARALTRDHRDLVDAVVALPADRQRALALRLARQACAAAPGPLDWQPALDAIAAGDPLPPPFDDHEAVLARALSAPNPAAATTVAIVSIGRAGPEPAREPLHPGVSAGAALRAAAADDPLAAALGAVEAASWSVPDLDAYFAGVADLVARRGS